MRVSWCTDKQILDLGKIQLDLMLATIQNGFDDDAWNGDNQAQLCSEQSSGDARGDAAGLGVQTHPPSELKVSIIPDTVPSNPSNGEIATTTVMVVAYARTCDSKSLKASSR